MGHKCSHELRITHMSTKCHMTRNLNESTCFEKSRMEHRRETRRIQHVNHTDSIKRLNFQRTCSETVCKRNNLSVMTRNIIDCKRKHSGLGLALFAAPHKVNASQPGSGCRQNVVYTFGSLEPLKHTRHLQVQSVTAVISENILVIDLPQKVIASAVSKQRCAIFVF